MLAKVYKPKDFEASIYQKWEKAGAFKPAAQGKPFSIIMPPPNANGALHWGHAIGYSLTDVIARYKRMQGYKTLWLPGTDHAGIETQVVFEKELAKTGRSRFDLGPEEFYKQALDFTLQAEGTILNQMRSMGFSADWSRKKFTLDDDIIEIVYDTFKKMHAAGQVYRGNRIINWCTSCLSGFADIELLHKEREDKFYTLDYGLLEIATTRPETIFADVAVAVNPKDKRHKNSIGQEAVIPLVDRPVPVIGDTAVDPNSGTGALKVTPGHDPTDYEIGKRHNLAEISVINQEGKLVNVPDELAGLSVEEGRAKTVAWLRQAGKLVKEEPIKHAVAIHERCGTVIEPLISEQWFLRIKPVNQPVIKALKADQVKFFPDRYKKIALNWLENEHDWNISRQNWFGIKIPVYYKTSHDPDKADFIVAKTEKEANDYYGAGNYRAETDTFDTWFSSGQWPYATLRTTGDFDQFYPTNLMGTARDLIHKWVTRMIMFGLYMEKEAPFRHVYLWGLVTDEKGQKMSKSKGNVVDPLEMISKYGADALRIAGAVSNTPGMNSPMSESRVVAMRNFVNKLWNVARFVLGQISNLDDTNDYPPTANTPADSWIIEQIARGSHDISAALDKYRLNEAADRLYHLVWDDFADWYVEASKVKLNREVLLWGLETILKLAHPFVPFVTEAIWQQLPGKRDLLIVSPWPTLERPANKAATKDFAKLQAVIGEIRTIRYELGLKNLSLIAQRNSLLDINKQLLMKLANIQAFNIAEKEWGWPLITSDGEAWLDIDRNTLKAAHKILQKRRQQAIKYKDSLKSQLSNPGLRSNAPKVVVNDLSKRYGEADSRAAVLVALDQKISELLRS